MRQNAELSQGSSESKTSILDLKLEMKSTGESGGREKLRDETRGSLSGMPRQPSKQIPLLSSLLILLLCGQVECLPSLPSPNGEYPCWPPLSAFDHLHCLPVFRPLMIASETPSGLPSISECTEWGSDSMHTDEERGRPPRRKAR